jgi:hypothetical protein
MDGFSFHSLIHSFTVLCSCPSVFGTGFNGFRGVTKRLVSLFAHAHDPHLELAMKLWSYEAMKLESWLWVLTRSCLDTGLHGLRTKD